MTYVNARAAGTVVQVTKLTCQDLWSTHWTEIQKRWAQLLALPHAHGVTLGKSLSPSAFPTLQNRVNNGFCVCPGYLKSWRGQSTTLCIYSTDRGQQGTILIHLTNNNTPTMGPSSQAQLLQFKLKTTLQAQPDLKSSVHAPVCSENSPATATVTARDRRRNQGKVVRRKDLFLLEDACLTSTALRISANSPVLLCKGQRMHADSQALQGFAGADNNGTCSATEWSRAAT